jgi:hypothetical protein
MGLPVVGGEAAARQSRRRAAACAARRLSRGGDDPFSEAMSRLNEATVAFLRGDLDRARALLETADTFFAESPMARVAIDDRFELDWLRDQLS